MGGWEGTARVTGIQTTVLFGLRGYGARLRVSIKFRHVAKKVRRVVRVIAIKKIKEGGIRRTIRQLMSTPKGYFHGQKEERLALGRNRRANRIALPFRVMHIQLA